MLNARQAVTRAEIQTRQKDIVGVGREKVEEGAVHSDLCRQLEAFGRRYYMQFICPITTLLCARYGILDNEKENTIEHLAIGSCCIFSLLKVGLH